jgi:hypothetical protein
LPSIRILQFSAGAYSSSSLIHLKEITMKTTLRLMALGAFTSLFTLSSCQRDSKELLAPPQADELVQSNSAPNTESCNSNAYAITLESLTQVGNNWEWVWSVQNQNPGNGNNGTVQDLSHWGMQFGECVIPSSVIAAAYSSNGSNWTSFTPSYEVDPSQDCMSTPVLKFDYGTSGSAKSYYRVTVNADYIPSATPGYYKSGNKTGCCTFYFTGIGCEDSPPSDFNIPSD